MPVDPAVQPILDAVNAMGGGQLRDLSPAEARTAYAAMASISGEGPPVAGIEARTIEGVPTFVVTPLEADVVAAGRPGGPVPVLVWFHGGGFVIGSAEDSLPVVREMARRAGCAVVTVEYRLAPEDPFPAGPDDCRAVTRWVLAHAAEIGGDPSLVAVGGDSAGGNLAAVTALDVAGLAAQVLVYPVTDLTGSHPSITENGEGYFLTADTMSWFNEHYLSGGTEATDPGVSPLFESDERLAASPPALVLTAEYDPLRDEGEAFAKRLAGAGVDVTLERYDGQIHGFLSMASLVPAATTALDQIGAHLRRAFAGPDPVTAPSQPDRSPGDR